MEWEVVDEKENKLLNRKEIKLNIKHPKLSTPSKPQLVKELAAKYSCPEENVLIDFILTHKGTNESFVKVKIYKEKPKLKVKKSKGEKKVEAQASEAK
jgi:small subunit ribosomal protein S24e